MDKFYFPPFISLMLSVAFAYVDLCFANKWNGYVSEILVIIIIDK